MPSAGDTLSLNNLAGATGQTAKSLSAARGSTANPIKMSDFSITGVYGPTGYTYIADNTTEVFTAALNRENVDVFNERIGSRAANFTWTGTGNFTISASPNREATITAGNMNPQAPDAQTTLVPQTSGTISVKFADGFNDHAEFYNTVQSKTIYIVDSYDGNSIDMCLTLDTPVQLADGTYIEVGELEEGMILKGTQFDGLEKFVDRDYLNWNTNTLFPHEEDVTVKSLVYGFAERIYVFNNGLVKSTMEHPFLVKEENGFYKFKRAHLLTTTDSFVQLIDGEYVETPITNIDLIEEPTEIVTIDVDGSNIYFANNIVSHNKDQGNSHTDFAPTSAPTGLWYTSATNTLTWDGGTILDPDVVSDSVAWEVQWSSQSDFGVGETASIIWGNNPQPTGYNVWQMHYYDFTSYFNAANPVPYTDTWSVQLYFRIREIANGGQYSGWTTINKLNGVTADNPKVTISNVIAV